MDSIANVQKAFWNIGGAAPRESDTTKKAHDLYEAWTGMGQSWANSMRDAFEEMMRATSQGVGREALANIFSSAETYMKLFEFWLPLYKSLQEKTFDPASYQRLFDSAQYKAILDKVFDFISPGTVNEFYENILDAYQRGLSPMFKIPAMGKYREHVELALNLLRKYPAFMAQYGQYQGRLYATGQQAMEKVMAQFIRRMKENSAPPSYDEFFKIWAEVNEQAFHELFTAEELVALQNELQNTGLAIKKDFQKLMALASYPIVLRSEMDELYKTIHDLKNRVHDLEKERQK